MKKIFFLTGIRSDYDIISPVAKKMRESREFKVGFIVAGAHLSDFYGSSGQLIEEDGYEIVGKIYNLINSDTKSARAKSIGIELQSLVDILINNRPDFLFVTGDREEPIIGAIAANYLDIPVIHLAGGDNASDGNIDNAIRHATSKLAHIHFVMLESHKERLIKMGENPNYIFVTGTPAIDKFQTEEKIQRDKLFKLLNFNINFNLTNIICLQHSTVVDEHQSYENMKITLEALQSIKANVFISYPNSDAGSQKIIKAISESQKNFFIYRNLSRKFFVNLLRNCNLLVGNSSLGIVETPFIKLPVVNIGVRQIGREHSTNVIFVDHDRNQITKAINKSLYDKKHIKNLKETCKSIYGDGYSADKIVKILQNIRINSQLLRKINAY